MNRHGMMFSSGSAKSSRSIRLCSMGTIPHGSAYQQLDPTIGHKGLNDKI